MSANPSWSVERYDYNTLAVRTMTQEDGFIYWADGYDPYWRGFVDGIEVPVYRANISFKAMDPPKGEHRIEFIYDPARFKRAVIVFFSAPMVVLLISLGYAALGYRDRLREFPSSP